MDIRTIFQAGISDSQNRALAYWSKPMTVSRYYFPFEKLLLLLPCLVEMKCFNVGNQLWNLRCPSWTGYSSMKLVATNKLHDYKNSNLQTFLCDGGWIMQRILEIYLIKGNFIIMVWISLKQFIEVIIGVKNVFLAGQRSKKCFWSRISTSRRRNIDKKR